MTHPTPVGFLDFFVLEGGEYIEQLDALVIGSGTPDAEVMQRIARALRGSATMAKLPPFAEVAAGLERVGRGLRDGTLVWDIALRGAVIAAVDDLKILLRDTRSWSAADDARASARAAELTSLAPLRTPTPRSMTGTQGHDVFLATEAANIGAGLELLATRPGDRESASNVLRRMRALRGIASVKDYAGLPDVLEAAEHAAQSLELGETVLSPERIAVLQSAATILRAAASGIRDGTNAGASPADLARFASALDAMQQDVDGVDRVVPIEDLFFQDDQPGVVQAASNPPTSPSERFRLEAVSQAENLRRVIADARAASDDLARERVRRELRGALRALRQLAESFREREIAEFVEGRTSGALQLDTSALKALDDVAGTLTQPGTDVSLGERLRRSVAVRASILTTPFAVSAIAPPTVEPQHRDEPAATAVAAAATQAGSPAARRDELLDSSIASLSALRATPLATPVQIAEQPPVAINVLLYRGRAAIERCREIREDLRRAGGTPDVAALGELFDLLDLALTD